MRYLDYLVHLLRCDRFRFGRYICDRYDARTVGVPFTEFRRLGL